jgi:hypothetical protein
MEGDMPGIRPAHQIDRSDGEAFYERDQVMGMGGDAKGRPIIAPWRFPEVALRVGKAAIAIGQEFAMLLPGPQVAKGAMQEQERLTTSGIDVVEDVIADRDATLFEHGSPFPAGSLCLSLREYQLKTRLSSFRFRVHEGHPYPDLASGDRFGLSRMNPLDASAAILHHRICRSDRTGRAQS